MRIAGLVILAAFGSGCWLPPYDDMAAPDESERASTIVEIGLESGAFLGPGARFKVVTDGQGVVRAQFGTRMTSKLANPEAVFEADDFPEGIATMILSIDDRWDRFEVERVHIDRTPPELVRISSATLQSGDTLEALVWDAVMLDRVELAFGGANRVVTLPREPATTSLVRARLKADELPEGFAEASLRVADGAGNETVRDFELLVDRTAPTVGIVAPVGGTRVSGVFEVEVVAEDNLGPTSVMLRASGSAIAEVSGPDGKLAVDASLFPAGPLMIEAVARDAAGNLSEPATVSVVVD
ncbi:MAG: hypothetical protein ACOX6T_02945 [Myxococcales bacterium]|jgi:hypothetical protein